VGVTAFVLGDTLKEEDEGDLKKNGGIRVYKTQVLCGIFSTLDATGWVSAWVSSFKNSSSN